MSKTIQRTSIFACICCCTLFAMGHIAFGAVTVQEAEQLKTTLTPLGGERAGNADGSIPAWDGGNLTVPDGYVNGVVRPDMWPDEKPIVKITSKNMDQYADKLTESTKAMLKKYPDFRVDVYPTHRTMAAPQWVYDNTFKNATRGRLNGYEPEKVYGGIPFPIPKSGIEVMWNHLLRWRSTAWVNQAKGYLVTGGGKRVLLVHATAIQQSEYYRPDGSWESFIEKLNGEYWLVTVKNIGPPIRAGEAITGRNSMRLGKTKSWVYLPGQRRVRRLPLACCDTPTAFSAGVTSFDEVEVFSTTESLPRFDWNIVEKKEMYIPYNTNKFFLKPDEEKVLMGDHFLNPDYIRWELHRVWVVEANLKDEERHTSPRSRYYVDEDSWMAVLGDRWDANGQLWRALQVLPVNCPDIPANVSLAWGYYDLLGGAYFMNTLFFPSNMQNKIVPFQPSRVFTPDAMAGEGVR